MPKIRQFQRYFVNIKQTESLPTLGIQISKKDMSSRNKLVFRVFCLFRREKEMKTLVAIVVFPHRLAIIAFTPGSGRYLFILQ